MDFCSFYTQSVHGLFESAKDNDGNPIRSERTHVKLQFIVNKMKKHNTGIYFIQASWDENDWINVIDGCMVFHHNTGVKTDRTGVAIMLAPRFSKAWKDAGGIEPLKTARGVQFLRGVLRRQSGRW